MFPLSISLESFLSSSIWGGIWDLCSCHLERGIGKVKDREMALLSKGTRAKVGEPEGHWGRGCREGRANQLLLSALTYFFEPRELSLSLLSATVTLPWGGLAANPHWMIAVPGIFLNVTRERHSLFPGGHRLHLWISGHLVPLSHLSKIGHRWVTILSTSPVWEAVDGGR